MRTLERPHWQDSVTDCQREVRTKDEHESVVLCQQQVTDQVADGRALGWTQSRRSGLGGKRMSSGCDRSIS